MKLSYREQFCLKASWLIWGFKLKDKFENILNYINVNTGNTLTLDEFYIIRYGGENIVIDKDIINYILNQLYT